MISRNAVKESFDTLPAGVGCFDRNGLPRLVNHKMQQLAAVLCGRDMQTLAELQQALRSPGGGVRLLDAEAGFYEFPDRRVYRFTARPCTDKYGVPYTEVMAVDATRPPPCTKPSSRKTSVWRTPTAAPSACATICRTLCARKKF